MGGVGRWTDAPSSLSSSTASRNTHAYDTHQRTVHCTASSAVVMAGVPQQNRSKNKAYVHGSELV